MTQAIATIQSQLPQFSQEQLKLITDTVAKGATQDELKLFLYRCQNMQLDPLKPGQIYFMKYGNSPGTIVVGIDGFRSRAARTGKLSGIKREVIRDDKGKCVGARCEVHRSDWQHPAIEEVALSEYNTGKAMWAKMPETMIKKVAEAAALRMAFPDDLGGVYSDAEMDQARESSSGVTPGVPGPDDGNTEPLEYKCVFGRYKQRTLEDVERTFGLEDMGKQLESVPAWLKKNGRALTTEIQDQLDRIAEYVGKRELEMARKLRGEEVESGPWENG